VTSEKVFIETYSCPHCKAELETGFDDWQGWQRCPTCGLAGLPPEPTGLRSGRQPWARSKVADDVLVISDSPENLTDDQPVAPAFGGRPAHIGPARLVFRTGLLVSLGLMLIFYLDRNTINAAIFGCLSVVFSLLLLRISGSRSPAS
jgi:hypothetical protein